LGVVGALVRYGDIIGTIRYIPLGRGLAPCDKLVHQYDIDPELLEDSWEVGRLVLDPNFRSSTESLKRCLFLTLVDLLEDTQVENLFASCSPVLSRLYRRFGFTVLVKEACEDAEGTYCLIQGYVPEVLKALATSAEERAIVARIEALRMKEALPC
jgi:hypothetical protein